MTYHTTTYPMVLKTLIMSLMSTWLTTPSPPPLPRRSPTFVTIGAT